MAHAVPVVSIVNDHRSVRRALRRLLRLAGYPAEAYASAYEFLASFPRDRTACVILDIHMEGMDGFALKERLAADGIVIPIIFITAQDDASTRERVQAASGVAGYLPKPFDQDALLNMIRTVAGLLPERQDEICVFCTKPIHRGDGRFAIQDGVAHVECYDERKLGKSKP
jgi:FixJ family two-component response regulator